MPASEAAAYEEPGSYDQYASGVAGGDYSGLEGDSTLLPKAQARVLSYPTDEHFESQDTAKKADGWDWALGSTTVPAPPKRTLQSLGVPDSLWRHFQTLSNQHSRQMSPDDPRYKEIPPEYHSAYCLDDVDDINISTPTSSKPSGSFGYPSVLYKVVSQEDGYTYALRRFDNVKCSHKIAAAAMEAWRRVRHPNIVKLYSCYVLNRALFFVHDYHVGSTTLKERYLDNRGTLLQERLLWSYISQIVAVTRSIHRLVAILIMW